MGEWMTAPPVEYEPLVFQRAVEKRNVLPLAAALVIAMSMTAGIVLRFWELGKASLWFDEGYTAWVISLPVKELVRAIHVDTAPPLYYLLLHGWVKIFGRSEFAMRMLSAIFSSLAIFVVWRSAVRLFRHPLATATAVALFSLSYVQIAYAHEARSYALVSLLAAVDLYLVLQLVDRTTWGITAAAITAFTLSLYTVNMMVFYLAALCAAWLVFPGETSLRHRLKSIAIVCGVSGVLFLPWLPIMLEQSRAIRGNFWASPPDRRLVLDVLTAITGVDDRAMLPMQHGATALITTLLLSTCAACMIWPGIARKGAALVCFAMGPIAFAYAYSWIRQPIFMERAFIASTVAVPMIFALLINRAPVRLRWVGVMLTAGLALLGLRSLQWNMLGEHSEPWREACLFAKSLESNDRRTLTVFVANEGETLFDYYARNGEYGLHDDRTGLPGSFFDADPPHTMRRVHGDADLNSLRQMITSGRFDAVTLIESHAYFGDRLRRAQAYLTSVAKSDITRQFDELLVYHIQIR